MADRHQDYISAVRAANRQIWDGIKALKKAQDEWNAGDYGNTMPDGEGENAGYTNAEVGAVAFGTADAFTTVLAAGHATNMVNLL